MIIFKINNISRRSLLIMFFLIQAKYIKKKIEQYKSLIISQSQAIKNNIFMLQYQNMIKSTDTCIPKMYINVG